jgi:RNA polymerase sigma factor (sigma-70 family)
MRREKETDLIHRARKGDTAAFGELVRRYQNLVHATAVQILKDAGLAEDVAQEAFISAYSALGELRHDGSFPPWLRKITRNRALAVRREQGRFGALEEAGTLQSPTEETLRDSEREQREGDAFGDEVRQIVTSLSDALRFPVLLCYIDDLPTRNTARFLGITEGALRKRLHDAKKKLQERIVKMAEKRFQEYRLPRDFAKRCICGCRRAQEANKKRR